MVTSDKVYKLCLGGVQSHLKFMVTGFPPAHWKCKYLWKLKLGVILAGHYVAMVTFCGTVMITLASDEEWL